MSAEVFQFFNFILSTRRWMCPGAADEVTKRHAILHRLVKHMDKEAPAFIEPPFTVDYARPTFAPLT